MANESFRGPIWVIWLGLLRKYLVFQIFYLKLHVTHIWASPSEFSLVVTADQKTNIYVFINIFGSIFIINNLDPQLS